MTQPVVEIDANGFVGLRFDQGSHGSSLNSLGIIDAGSAGVTLNASNVSLFGNFIGVDLDGATGAGNDGDGVQINASSSNNMIGGAPGLGGNPAQNRNIISGNSGNGIGIYGSSHNKIIDTFVGTDATGTVDLGNAGNGILVTGGARFNHIGGTTPLPGGKPVPDNYQCKPSDGNVISGNDQNGVLLAYGAHNNLLAGNFIGTDLSGNEAVGNSLDGVAILKGSNKNALLGAFFTGPENERPFVFYNVVSGNGGNGLRIQDSNHTVVHANFFGMAADNGSLFPNRRIGNQLNGVLVEGSSRHTQFGGPIPLGNVVASNGKHGIEIRDRASNFVSDNTFSRRRRIYQERQFRQRGGRPPHHFHRQKHSCTNQHLQW